MNQPQSTNFTTSGVALLIEAASNANAVYCEKFLAEKPELVNEQGWNGLTALHRSCLRGDLMTTQVLLDAGADPNIINDAGETPFHLAAKRGILAVIGLLVERGASVNAIDDLGKHAMHHAAQSGWIIVMQYLTEVHQVSSDCTDSRLQTPLHIVCQHGHLDAARYLLHNQKSDVLRIDSHGNTALHYAAMHRSVDVCWLLLSTPDGRSALLLPNKENFTPYDLAYQSKPKASELALTGNIPGVNRTAKWLNHWTRHAKKRPPRINWLWWWYAVMPAMSAVVILSLCYLLVPNYQVVIAGPGFLLLTQMIMRHQHRIMHPSKLANPIFLGLFLAGMTFTTVCYGYIYFPVLFAVSPLLHYFGISVLSASFLMFFLLLKREPGFVRHPRSRSGHVSSRQADSCRTNFLQPLDHKRCDTENRCHSLSATDGSTDYESPYMTVNDVALRRVPQECYCGLCEIIIPERARHCRLCEHCIHDMDHHCLFLMKCIARDNHRLFLTFIIAIVTSMVLFLFCSYLYVTDSNESLMPFDAFLNTFFSECIVPALVIGNVLTLIWCLFLLRYQFYLISMGQTTVLDIQKMPGSQIKLTFTQKLLNIFKFFFDIRQTRRARAALLI